MVVYIVRKPSSPHHSAELCVNKFMEFYLFEDTKDTGETKTWELEELYRHYDPFHGMEYIANYVASSFK